MDSRDTPSFTENRANIKNFFETQKLTQQLRNQVKEFFEVQHTFHLKMNNLVQACSEIYGQLTDEQQQLLEKLLAPYLILIANPFEEKPSGNLEMDLMHIFGVINARNSHFAKILPAMFLSMINLEAFSLLLVEMRKNKEIAAIILRGINSEQWMHVQGHVDLPYQNLMRYDLLLKTIRETLEKSGCEEVEPVLLKIMDAIRFIMPELKYINEHRSTLMLLNEIDMLVVELAKINVLRDPQPPADALTFDKKVEAVRLYIASARTNIAKAKEAVIDVLQGLQHLLEMLQEDTEITLTAEQQSYYSQGYYLLVGLSATLFGENSIFAKPAKDPREKLRDVIAELKKKIIEEIMKGEAVQYIRQREAGR
jgi:hypothetical protein